MKVDFFLNFTPYVLDASGNPITDGSGNLIKSDDGCDIIYGDNGNDWLVGGTDTNWLFGGFGDDLLQSSQNLETDGELNRMPEDATWSDPTFAYGGAGRDVLIADTGRARMFDWTRRVQQLHRPVQPVRRPGRQPHARARTIRDFISALSVAGGADQTFTPGLAARRARRDDAERRLLQRPARRPARPAAGQRPRRPDRLPRQRRPRPRLPVQPG